MQKQDWPYGVAALLCVSLAIGSGFYMVSGGSAPLAAVILSVFALALCQVVVFVYAARRSLGLENDQSDTQNELAGLVHRHAESRQQFDVMQSKLDATVSAVARDRDMVSRGFADLKHSYESLLTELQRTAYQQAPAPMTREEPVFAQPHAPAPEANLQQPEAASPFGDQLAVSLEPVIDLSSGRTAHYRMHLGLGTEQNGDTGSELFLHHADRIGARPALDVFVAREADVLLRRLRQRDPQLSIFIPIGAATLAAPIEINQIIADRKAASDVASGMVFELPHAMLAGLTDQALEGLATLARNGARFALSNVSISGLDLAAMNTLNVRYVGLDAGAIDPERGPTMAMAAFTQSARAARVQMIVTGVADARIIGKLPQITRLVSGPCFAAPRRVKQGVVENAAELYAAA